jgi:hypothetical protein
MSAIAQLVLGKYGGELGNSNPAELHQLAATQRQIACNDLARGPQGLRSEWRSAQNRLGGPNRASGNGSILALDQVRRR